MAHRADESLNQGNNLPPANEIPSRTAVHTQRVGPCISCVRHEHTLSPSKAVQSQKFGQHIGAAARFVERAGCCRRPPAALETSEAAGRALLELVDVDARSARYAALDLRALRLGLY
eukprot:scaffold5708_cov72-Phaeocystis_antarctica.AAC.6